VAQYGHAFQIPRQASQGPLAFHLLQAAQQELAESHDRFDDAEHRLHGLFAQGVPLPARLGLELVRHLFQGRCVGGERLRLGEAFAPAGVVVFPRHGDERFDLGCLTRRRGCLQRLGGLATGLLAGFRRARFNLGFSLFHGGQAVLPALEFFGQVDAVGEVGLVGFLRLREQVLHFGFELDFELLNVAEREGAVARGVGVNPFDFAQDRLGAVQADRA